MSNEKKLISIVVPVLNEEENLDLFYTTVKGVADRLADRYDFEMVFTDNHSTDGTFSKLCMLHMADKRVRVVRFSRNFGYQRSILTGYLKSRGDAVIQLDCDLQDPPDMIPEFLRHWEAGCAVVYGIRKKREEGFFIHQARRIFYRLINWLSEDELPLDAGDFRLVDRKVVDVLRLIDDAQPYLRGTIASMGFEQKGVEYDRQDRKAGSSKFGLKQLVGLAFDGILNHSVIPLRVATFFGFIVTAAALISIPVYLGGRLIGHFAWPPGFTTTTVLLLAGIGINALFLGVIGEYLGRIYKQVKKKPITIVEKELSA
jgi:glycosyltransferase involved in cell wall biosynthesis